MIRPLKTHCKHGHAFTPGNTRLREQRNRPGLKRDCRMCESLRMRHWREKESNWQREKRRARELNAELAAANKLTRASRWRRKVHVRGLGPAGSTYLPQTAGAAGVDCIRL